MEELQINKAKNIANDENLKSNIFNYYIPTIRLHYLVIIILLHYIINFNGEIFFINEKMLLEKNIYITVGNIPKYKYYY